MSVCGFQNRHDCYLPNIQVNNKILLYWCKVFELSANSSSVQIVYFTVKNDGNMKKFKFKLSLSTKLTD